MIRIAIAGSAGRMGRQIAALAIASEQFDVVGSLEAPGHQALGRDIGELAGVGAFGVAVTASLDASADVLIDFSLPEGTIHWLDVCRKRSTPMVIGTTGLTDSQESAVADATGTIPIVKTSNYSVGINLLCKLAATAAEVLGGDYDVEITETHHRFKKDAPSGTAIMLARAICRSTGADYDEAAVFGRHGRCPREPGQIGIHALRVGDTVGEHAVHFGNLGETITLSHSAHTREAFARGALRAAQWVTRQKPGLYSMQNVVER